MNTGTFSFASLFPQKPRGRALKMNLKKYEKKLNCKCDNTELCVVMEGEEESVPLMTGREEENNVNSREKYITCQSECQVSHFLTERETHQDQQQSELLRDIDRTEGERKHTSEHWLLKDNNSHMCLKVKVIIMWTRQAEKNIKSSNYHTEQEELKNVFVFGSTGQKKDQTHVIPEKETLNSTGQETQQGHNNMMGRQVQYDCYKGEGEEMKIEDPGEQQQSKMSGSEEETHLDERERKTKNNYHTDQKLKKSKKVTAKKKSEQDQKK